MKLFKYLVLVLVLAANLLLAQPSWAGNKHKSSLAKNPEYIEVTQTLDDLKKAKETQTQIEDYTPEQLQQKIDELEFRKYTLESGINWSQCSNETGKTVAVYGPKAKKSKEPYDNGLYFLADGQTTEKKWNCEGFYVPNDGVPTDLTVTGQNGQQSSGALAVKIPNGTNVVLKRNSDTGVLEFNVPFTKVLKPGDVNWFIPNVSQAFIDTRVPNAPIVESKESQG
ncbi:hypothetical protein H6S82_10955 [Planktothrix sp. FACHB-1355]|uniref:Uncharacterized protein n=1 Tax=Aerosakkonema funiforme FACHB-1375 TaxID=2949571 RepID=A0A926VCC1_9CYAN|nr:MULTISPECIES: hypothetical protein [Oscillatoriales]MBD2180945.1 hypothetical protein [Aerosakkonema funiforme FACHB-1375]MBD3559381.1 hypothetical protein [Planktothrix sp. FACHB-1355]